MNATASAEQKRRRRANWQALYERRTVTKRRCRRRSARHFREMSNERRSPDNLRAWSYAGLPRTDGGELGLTQGCVSKWERFGRGLTLKVITDYAERRTSESEYALASLSLIERQVYVLPPRSLRALAGIAKDNID